ncbi:MAG: hypothetical protein GX103_14985, partial [Bacteroidales bacterium]|nr:hypothetical protein [Bacteroidales bacterium]
MYLQKKAFYFFVVEQKLLYFSRFLLMQTLHSKMVTNMKIPLLGFRLHSAVCFSSALLSKILSLFGLLQIATFAPAAGAGGWLLRREEKRREEKRREEKR